MTRITISEARNDLSETINKVAYGGSRVMIHRHGKDMVAIISKEDLEILEYLEDQADLAVVREAMKETQETVAWGTLKDELNAKHGISD